MLEIENSTDVTYRKIGKFIDKYEKYKNIYINGCSFTAGQLSYMNHPSHIYWVKS